ncbi:MAG: oxidoreductase [Bacteroidota bacterium]
MSLVYSSVVAKLDSTENSVKNHQKEVKKNRKKVVLITGASSGIGKSTAIALHNRGYVVYAAARRIAKMEDLRKKGIHIIKLDITDEKLICSCIAEVIREQGGIDILINNAGLGIYGSVEETSLDDARYQFEVNLFGLARLTQLILPYMRKQGSGIIINVSSIVGKIYLPLGSWYVASKHALEGWSDCLRTELEPFGIRVIIIEPGITKTEFGEVMYAPMMERSGAGPYKGFLTNISKEKRQKDSKKKHLIGSDPSVIAQTIIKAIQARKPATRYPTGKYAKLFLWIRRWVSDRLYDWLIAYQFKSA